jgi:hypothetical protein
MWCHTCYFNFHYHKERLVYGGFDAYFFDPADTQAMTEIKEGLQTQGSKWNDLEGQ